MMMKPRLRAIEVAWRAAWMRAIAWALPGARTATPPDWSARPHKVLFLRYERIGDMIMATGMIRVLAQSHPNIVLDVLANPATAPVLAGNPHVRKVYTLDRRSWRSYLRVVRQLRRERYDVIVDGRINNPPIFTSTPLLMLAARARLRIGAGGHNNHMVYNVCVEPYDRVTHYVQASRALAGPFRVDVDAVDWQPEIVLPDDERERAERHWRAAASPEEEKERWGRRLLVNLSASEHKRRWPDVKFAAVLRDVRAEVPELAIIVMGLPREWNSVEQVAHAVGAVPVETPSLRDALALVGTSDLVFTPDTSISHAASAFRKPAAVLLKREHHPYAPWNTPGEIISWQGETIHRLRYETVSPVVLRFVRRFGRGARGGSQVALAV